MYALDPMRQCNYPSLSSIEREHKFKFSEDIWEMNDVFPVKFSLMKYIFKLSS